MTCLAERIKLSRVWHDEFLLHKPLWIAKLSNGEEICQDDNLPGAYPPKAWDRLRLYLGAENLQIDELYLRFMSHVESPLPKQAKGYFFVTAVGASPGEEVQHLYTIGYVTEDDQIVTKVYKVPELIESGGGNVRPLELGIDNVFLNR